MAELEAVLDELERALEAIEELDEDVCAPLFEVLGALDVVHRLALQRVASLLGPQQIEAIRSRDAAAAWLFDAYGVGVDERAEAEGVLEGLRPYLRSQGGEARVTDVRDGVVRVALSVSRSSGCGNPSASLRNDIEEALRDSWPGFVRLEVEEESPPVPAGNGSGVLQIRRRSRRARG